jgi:N-acetyl sugar amidotransferase
MMSDSRETPGMLEAYYGLPRTVTFCARCVISNQRPSSVVEFKSSADKPKQTIGFDEHGVCAACRYQDIKDHKIDWAAREQALLDLCREYRSKAGNYDCVVPGSGGKDSTFTAHVLKYRYGMNPLTVTWAPNVYTDVGFRNLHNWIDSGLDNILFTPNGRVHRILTRLAFENLVHPFQPFIVGQRHVAPKTSVLYGIPLVFYGENQAEYGNNIDDNFIPTMKPEFYSGSRDIADVRLGGVSGDELVKSHGVDPRELEAYLPTDEARIRQVGTTVHYLGYYLKWDPQECYYYAAEHAGFTVNDERTEGSYSKYSSIDDRIDPLHYYTTFIKFGIGRATYDAAQEIRNGKITREEGVALVRRYDDEFPHKYFREILDYMGISEDRFYEVIDGARSPHLWRLDDGKWHLRHAVWMEQ